MRTAEIIPVEAVYFEAARRTRAVARMFREAKRFGEALTLNAEARRLDAKGFKIQSDANAAARALARNNGDPWTSYVEPPQPQTEAAPA